MTLVTSAVGWTHPDAESLRTQMTAELGPRYASLRHSRPARIDVDPATVLVTLVLQTGVRQPEAVELYERLGWQSIEPFGEYTGDQYSLCYAKEIA